MAQSAFDVIKGASNFESTKAHGKEEREKIQLKKNYDEKNGTLSMAYFLLKHCFSGVRWSRRSASIRPLTCGLAGGAPGC